MTEERLSDHAVEQLIGRLLQIGVAVSALVILLGGILVLMHHGAEIPVYTPFRGEPAAIRTLAGIVQGTIALDPRSIVQFGLILLISTPILRVAFTLVAFVIQKDRLYILVTSIVLVLLLYSLISGRSE